MEPYLLWGLALLGVAVLLVAVELFVPSGGLIAVTAALVAVSGVVCLFIADPIWGVVGLLCVIVLAPIMFFGGLKIWASTPIGRMMIGEVSEADRLASIEAQTQDYQDRMALLDAEGEAITDLRPVGVVRIDGTRYDAMADTHMIEAGSRVRVIHIDGMMVKVRKVDSA